MQEKSDERFKLLLKKWLANELSKEDYLEFYQSLKDEKNRFLFSEIIDQSRSVEFEKHSHDANWEKMYDSIKEQTHRQNQPIWKKYLPLAAAVILIFSIAIIILGPDQNTSTKRITSIEAPNSSNIEIKNSKGKVISWAGGDDEKHFDDLKMFQNELHVQDDDEELTYYTVNNPRGSAPLKIVLADGSSLVLNAASSINFPNRFDSGSRRVSLEGEGLFEVAHSASKPFEVESQNLTVQVLGTVFNLKAFSNEKMETTLLEGSVKVIDRKGNQLLLNPGEQAVYNPVNSEFTHRKVDSENILAWQHGQFIFGDESLKTVLLRIERLYDVDCEFAATYKDVRIWGSISTKNKLEDLLPLLETVSGKKLKLQGRTIHVK